jgi:hypothetical protein
MGDRVVSQAKLREAQAAGFKWASEPGRVRKLKRLAKDREVSLESGCRWFFGDGGRRDENAAEQFVQVIENDNRVENDTVTGFWHDALGGSSNYPCANLVDAFAEGVLQFFDAEVATQLVAG